VWVHERGRKAPYRRSPRRIGALPDFYAIDESAGIDKSEIEQKVLNTAESWIPPIIKRLEHKQGISDVDREQLAIFTAFAQTRVPHFKKIFDDFEERVARKVLHTGVADVERAKVTLKRAEEEAGEKFTITPEKFREFIRDDSRYAIIPHRHSALSAMLDVAPQIAEYIFRMHWFFYHAAGRARYITSDAPVVLADPSAPSRGTGYALPGAEVTFPLTPRLLFIATWKHGPPSLHTDVDDGIVRAVNRRTIAFHDQYLFSSTQHIDR
jgi:hypothetical protein